MAELVASFRLNGLVTDVPAFAVPPDKWTAVSQVNFREGLAERRQGYATPAGLATPAAGGPQFLLYHSISTSPGGSNYLWYGGVAYGGTAAIVGQQLAGVDSAVTPGTWGAPAPAPGKWTGGLLNNLTPVLNNQTSVPVYWDALFGTGWNVLLGWPPTGAGTDYLQALRVYREFLIGMGRQTSGGAYRPDVVYWSDAAPYNGPPTTWDAAATNQAGDAVLPGGGECVDGEVLGDDFIVYKRNASYRMRYVGGNYVMAIDPLFKGWGALSQNCVAGHGGKHYVFTGTDLIVHDGQQWQSMIAQKVRKLIRDNLSTTDSEAQGSHLFYNPVHHELWLNLVTTGTTYPTKALVVDVENGEAGWYDQPTVSSMAMTPLARYATMAYYGTGSASSGRFYRQDSGNTAAGTNITASLTREALDFGDPAQRKTVLWVRPHLKPTGSAVTMGVEVGYADTPQATPTYTASQNFVTGTDDKVNIRSASGRFLSFRFTTSDSVAHWQMSGFDVGYTMGGRT